MRRRALHGRRMGASPSRSASCSRRSGCCSGRAILHYVSWAARGYADPLGAIAFLGGLVPARRSVAARGSIGRRTPAFWAALPMALAAMIRPNLARRSACCSAGWASRRSRHVNCPARGALPRLLGDPADRPAQLVFRRRVGPAQREHACAERAADDAIRLSCDAERARASRARRAAHCAGRRSDRHTVVRTAGLRVHDPAACAAMPVLVRVVLSRRSSRCCGWSRLRRSR